MPAVMKNWHIFMPTLHIYDKSQPLFGLARIMPENR